MSNPETPSRLPDPEVLIFETSPFGTLDAIVQHDGLAVYFYLNQRQENGNFGTRACWVRNLEIGPFVINEEEMRQGISPQVPRTHCVHRDGQPLPQPDDLSIVWFEEGNGAALVESKSGESKSGESKSGESKSGESKSGESKSGESKTLAIIPPWSGLDGFNGYALECATECQVCWPMPDNPNLVLRIERSSEFWKSIGDPASTSSFAKLQTELLETYETRFGSTSNPSTSNPSTSNSSSSEPEYFSIDGGQFPPRGLVRMHHQQQPVLVTVGMSFCPQPAVEIFNDNPAAHRRIELGLMLRGLDEDVVQSALKQISSLAGYPWRNFTWLGEGHTCDFKNVFPGCDSVLLVGDSQLDDESKETELPSFRNDPINLIWLIPVTNKQLDQLKANTITANQIVSEHQSI